MIIIIPVIIVIAVVGYFVLQTYGTPQNIQNEASKVISNAGSTIQQISSQAQQSASSERHLPTFEHGATESFTASTNILTTNVYGTSPMNYLVVIKDSNGNIMKNEQFTLTESDGLDVRTFDLTGISKPASLAITVDGTPIYTNYVGSPFTDPSNHP